MKYLLSILLLLMATLSPAHSKESLPQHLQDISVTIKSGYAQGSGIIFTREVKPTKDSKETIKVNFVWTAAHVVDNLRRVRTVIDPKTGSSRKIVEFKDAAIVKELVEGGRRVGELKMEAKVLRYSDADNGEDLAILMIRKTNFVDASVSFYLDKPEIIPIGTKLYHVGSLRGQVGANSMTSGIMSQVGRVLDLGADGKTFAQTTATAFPGSSGGGVFLTEQSQGHEGECIGLLVRGAGETFNLVVPIRRIKKWAKRANVEWALSQEVSIPSLAEIVNHRIEDTGVDFLTDEKSRKETNDRCGTKFFLIDNKPDCEKVYVPQ